MKKIKVNFFSPFFPYKTGISAYSEDLIYFLNLEGIEVVKVNHTFWKVNKGLRVYSSRLAFAANKFIAIGSSFFYKSPKMEKDVINHFQLSGGQHNYIILKYFNKVNGPKVVTIHENFYTRNLINPLDEIDQLRVIKESDLILVHTKELRDKLQFMNKNIKVILHGVDINKFKLNSKEAKKRLNLEGNIIACIGFLLGYKGIENFIKAVKNINSTVLIVGSGPSLSRLKKLANFLCPNKVRFIPYVSELIFPYYIAASDIIVFPRFHSKGEASGVLVKAMAAGRGIVANNIGCFREYLSPNRGMLVDTFKINKFSSAIIKLLKNKELREEYGQNSHKFAKEVLDWKLVAKKHKQAYASLL